MFGGELFLAGIAGEILSDWDFELPIKGGT